jgi:Carboxypeptidase regulatory-like domain
MMHRKGCVIILATLLIAVCLPLIAGQDAATPGGTAATQPAPSESSSARKSKHSHADDLVIRGTVFSERGLALPGVKLRVRKADQKKSHWETYTNSRGEFAVRVPKGPDYEIAAESKGFAKQSQAINGQSEENVILHMQPVSGGKK